MQYCSLLLVAYVVKEMFSTAMNQLIEKDISTKHAIEQPIMKLSNKAHKLINKLNIHINKFVIETEEMHVNNCYKFKISSNKCTLQEILQYVYLIGHILNCLTFGYNEHFTRFLFHKIYL